MARVGQETEAIVSGTLAELLGCDFGGPLHSLVLVAPGTPHDLEAEMLAHYRITAAQAVGYAEDFIEWNGQPPQPEEEEESGVAEALEAELEAEEEAEAFEQELEKELVKATEEAEDDEAEEEGLTTDDELEMMEDEEDCDVDV
jgi:hypothetical protein